MRNQRYPHHGFQENEKLVAGDDRNFLENYMHWIQMKLSKFFHLDVVLI